jgi:hypothetical protein
MHESDHDLANVRSKRYWIARTTHPCAHCAQVTVLAALAVPPGHETVSQAEGTADVQGSDHWEQVWLSAFLFEVDSLPHHVTLRVAALAKGYRLTRESPERSRGWLNHCEHCGAPQEDQELFCEPEGAFFPTSVTSAAIIELFEVDEPMTVFAGGYVPSPPFFEFMRRA